MNCFFSLIYIIPNRFSAEKIAVGLLANLNGVPHFAISDRKLNFALAGFSTELKAAIRRGFRFMDFDVNKIKRGEESLSLFDPPYAKKRLKELAEKKRGVIQYSDVFELNLPKSAKADEFEKLFKKFMGEPYQEKSIKQKELNFKTRFKAFVLANRKLAEFEFNFKLQANLYPFIYKDTTVDLCRKSNYFTLFYCIDFSKSIETIQGNMGKFRTIVESLQQVSVTEGLSTGRYYMVYENTRDRHKMALMNTIKAEKNSGYDIIQLTEILDKI